VAIDYTLFNAMGTRAGYDAVKIVVLPDD
jgi:hypothetical protein